MITLFTDASCSREHNLCVWAFTEHPKKKNRIYRWGYLRNIDSAQGELFACLNALNFALSLNRHEPIRLETDYVPLHLLYRQRDRYRKHRNSQLFELIAQYLRHNPIALCPIRDGNWAHTIAYTHLIDLIHSNQPL